MHIYYYHHTIKYYHYNNNGNNNNCSSPTISVEPEDATVEQKLFSSAERAAKAMIILNYLIFLHETESHSQLKQAFKVKLFLFELINSLGHQERDRLGLGIVGNIYTMPVVCYQLKDGKEGRILRMTMEEVQKNLEERARILKEEEEWAAKLAADAKVTRNYSYCV